MNKHVSVFSLFARCSIYKVLVLMAVMIGAESLWFFSVTGYETTGEAAFDLAHLEWFFGAGAVLLTLLLLRTASSETTRYTLNRLRVSRGSVFLSHGLYNTCVYLLLWLVQTLTAAVLCGYFLAHSEGVVQSQDFMLTFYRQNFLHSLLPMAETMLWWRNILLAAALGFGAAHFSLRRRLGTVSYILIAAAVGAALFVNGLGFSGSEMTGICLSVGTLIYVGYQTVVNKELES